MNDERAVETLERLSPTLKPDQGVNRLSTDTTSTFCELNRIRRLLTRSHFPTANLFEAETMRAVAYRLACDCIRRGVFDFSDIADLMPDMWDCDPKPRCAQ